MRIRNFAKQTVLPYSWYQSGKSENKRKNLSGNDRFPVASAGSALSSVREKERVSGHARQVGTPGTRTISGHSPLLALRKM